MKTKLHGMEGWAEVEDAQDGIRMIKLLHRVYFDTDGSRQSMREMVLTDKKIPVLPEEGVDPRRVH